MVEVKWTLQSLEDMENIAAYISKDSSKYASLQINRFFEAAVILETFPKTGRIVPETRNKNIRELIVGVYRIIYLIKTTKRIDVLLVFHSRRLLKSTVLRNRIRK